MDAALEELQAEYPWVDEPTDPDAHRWHPADLRDYFESDGDTPPQYAALKQPREYGDWILQEPVMTGPPQPSDMVRLRLFCFAQAGMGAWAFHGWVSKLPLWVEVMPLEFPGRNSRAHEKAAKSCVSLARDTFEGLEHLLDDKPYAVIAHSMGSWVCHEFVREAMRRGAALPVKMYLSGTRAPQLAGCENDVDRANPSLHILPKEKFWPAFELRYNQNPDLAEDFIKDYIFDTLKADFELLETYKPTDVSPLPVPVCAMGAHGDVRYSPEQISAWKHIAGAHFHEMWFKGKEGEGYWGNAHRYMVDHPDMLLAFLSQDLLTVVP